ncbi:hypothetical protein [Mycobacteroides abscessus]|uniref:hypothetical protein n=1 Tax=Mycobacteroides abscessus TaxID=36809 RepID=UPI0019D0A41E|nr:hypothetical protein [Mycobacteroides abscessus]MBN7374604.1 hypothetical protein [Mycobacteroides abscessus subsp. abscessus]
MSATQPSASPSHPASRIPNTRPVLHIGPAATNEPWIEVIADNVTPSELIIFHAMMLRPTLIASLQLDTMIAPEYGPQRA